MRKSEIEDFRSYIEQKEYLDYISHFQNPDLLPDPIVKEINKKGTTRKRIVFTYPRGYKYIMKCIAFLIRDYFNSVDPDDILSMVWREMADQTLFIQLLDHMLHNPYALREGERVQIRKGIMAGVPMAGFLANLYLMEMDQWFEKENVAYIRYSDDIIVFSSSEEKIAFYENKIKSFLRAKKLEINEKKEYHFQPGDRIEFLGFEFSGHKIDISATSVQKIKDKMKRKARALYRWKIKKNASDERTIKAYIRFLNKKFYHNPIRHEITWCRWYFPVITSDESLRVLDQYAVDCIRYLKTGRYGKQNYNLRYEEICQMGFQNLINAYWKDLKNR